jgi:hypothetical protein
MNALDASAPCKGCTDRQLACHASCDKYKHWKADRDTLTDVIRRDKQAYYAATHRMAKTSRRPKRSGRQ